MRVISLNWSWWCGSRLSVFRLTVRLACKLENGGKKQQVGRVLFQAGKSPIKGTVRNIIPFPEKKLIQLWTIRKTKDLSKEEEGWHFQPCMWYLGSEYIVLGFLYHTYNTAVK